MSSRFEELFAGFQRSAWRLEVRDVYNIPDEEERIAEFLSTGRVPAKTRDNSSWIRTVEAARARGAYIGRVRLLGHPVTDYTRFELAAYEANVASGEDIRILDRARLDSSWDQAPDVWVFDDEVAIKMVYTDDGAWLGTEDLPAEPYANLRRAITPYAVPFAEYHLTEVPVQRTESPTPMTLFAALAAA
jgi:hypothetical protein